MRMRHSATTLRRAHPPARRLVRSNVRGAETTIATIDDAGLGWWHRPRCAPLTTATAAAGARDTVRRSAATPRARSRSPVVRLQQARSQTVDGGAAALTERLAAGDVASSAQRDALVFDQILAEVADDLVDAQTACLPSSHHEM